MEIDDSVEDSQCFRERQWKAGVIPIYSEEWVSKHLFGKDKKTRSSPATEGQKKLWIQPKNKKNRLQNRLCSQVL